MLGKKDVNEIQEPSKIAGYEIPVEKKEFNQTPTIINEVNLTMQKELAELKTDFFNKMMAVDEKVNNIDLKLSEMEQNKPVFNDDAIVSKVLQKMPMHSPTMPNINIDSIVSQVLVRVPKTTGVVVYEVEPLEKPKPNKDIVKKAWNVIKAVAIIGGVVGLYTKVQWLIGALLK